MSVLEVETRQNQAKLIALLSAGMSRRAACKTLGIGYTTASNWANEPEFSKWLRFIFGKTHHLQS